MRIRGVPFENAALALLLLVSSLGTARSAIFCVKPSATGSGTGVDWNNALGSSFTPVRGNTYYLADGSYGGKTFSTAASGTSLISIKKANSLEHVTETGWNSADGDGMATFGSCTISTDYWEFDGQNRDANWKAGSVSQYGIRFSSGGGVAMRFDGADHVTFKYCDLLAGGRDTGLGDDVVYTLTGPTYITFQYCALRDSDRTIFLTRGTPTDWLVEYCYIARNASSPATHGEIMSSTDSARMVFRYNYIEDPEGTAVWAFINGGTATDWGVYGNVIFHSSSYNREGISGVMFVANDASNNNSMNGLRFYNNTIWNINGLWCGVIIQSGTDNIVENNIWSQCTTPNNSGGSYNYNSYYATTTQFDSGANSQTVSTQPLRSPSTGDFTLAAATTAGRTLSSPYNLDPNGVTRGAGGIWDRGAFEFGSTITNATLFVSPQGLDFGSIATNMTSDQTVTVRNSGGGTLSGTASVASPFSIVSGGTYSLSANQSQTVTVRFSPIVIGSTNRSVVFTGGGGATAAVTGIGVVTQPPTITSNPTSTTASIGQTASFSVVVTGTAPLSYQWQRNGVNISGATAGLYNTPILALSDDGDNFRVVVSNSVGSVTSAAATLTVNSSPNSAPTVAIMSPSTSATFTAPATVVISANTSDSDGSVVKVEFFNGAVKIGEDSTTPFSLDWANVGVGGYVLTAVATDNLGAVATSAGVSITVTQGSTGGAFKVGDRVKVNIDPSLRVRSTPAVSGTVLGSQLLGDLGTVKAGPVDADGFTWWQVDYDSSPDGWSIQGDGTTSWLMLATTNSLAPPSGLRVTSQ